MSISKKEARKICRKMRWKVSKGTIHDVEGSRVIKFPGFIVKQLGEIEALGGARTFEKAVENACKNFPVYQYEIWCGNGIDPQKILKEE